MEFFFSLFSQIFTKEEKEMQNAFTSAKNIFHREKNLMRLKINLLKYFIARLKKFFLNRAPRIIDYYNFKQFMRDVLS